MSRMNFSFTRGLTNAIVTVIFFIVVPNLVFTALEGYIPGLSVSAARTISAVSTGAFLVAMSFCRGAFPRHSVVWALAGIGSSLFAAVYLYILLVTPVSYGTTVSGQPIEFIFDFGFLALLMAAVLALNSLNNLIELSKARRKKTETERVTETKIAA